MVNGAMLEKERDEKTMSPLSFVDFALPLVRDQRLTASVGLLVMAPVLPDGPAGPAATSAGYLSSLMHGASYCIS